MDNRRQISPTIYTPVHVACAVVFAVFSFVYIYHYQCDILTYTQSVLSEGKTHFNRGVGAFLITLVLYLTQRGINAMVRLYARAHAISYFPSMLILAFITDAPSDLSGGYVMGHWAWVLPLSLCLFIGVAWVCKQIQPFEPVSGGLLPFMRPLWINIWTMVALMVMVCMCSNSDTLFHYQLRMEQQMVKGRYDKVLKTGAKYRAVNAEMMQMRAMAMAMRGELGERFFHYPVTDSRSGLVPDEGKQTKILPVNALSNVARHDSLATEYQMIENLRQRQIERFAKEAIHRYPDSIFPRHYKEAMVIYDDVYEKAVVTDTALMLRYRDYKYAVARLRKENKSPKLLKKYFGDSYWFYYEFGPK